MPASKPFLKNDERAIMKPIINATLLISFAKVLKGPFFRKKIIVAQTGHAKISHPIFIPRNSFSVARASPPPENVS